MGKIRKNITGLRFLLILSITILSTVHAEGENAEVKTDDGVIPSSEEFDVPISLHGDLKVNFGALKVDPNSEESSWESHFAEEPAFYSDEIPLNDDYSHEDYYPGDDKTRKSAKHSEMDGDSYEVHEVEDSEEIFSNKVNNKTVNPSQIVDVAPALNLTAAKPLNPENVDIAPALNLTPAIPVNPENVDIAPALNLTPAIPVNPENVDIAPALPLTMAKSVDPENEDVAPRLNLLPADPATSQIIPDDVVSDEDINDEVATDQKKESAPASSADQKPSVIETAEAAVEQESKELNKLERELERWTNPRYSEAAKNHRVLLTSIIIGFFALSIATVLFTFYRGFMVFTQIMRRRSGGRYSRMEEEPEQPTLFQQKV